MEGARREIEEAGGEALVTPTDVANFKAAAAQVEEAWGPIDVWINDAKATVFSPFDKVKPEDYKRAVEV